MTKPTEISSRKLKELFLVVCKKLEAIETSQAEIIDLLASVSPMETSKDKPLSYTA